MSEDLFHLAEGKWNTDRFAENIRTFTATAYHHCINWFGLPCDPEWPLHIYLRSQPCCKAITWARCYIIVLEKDRESWEPVCGTLAHEMYHRVTTRRQGLHKQLWIDEMLAILVQNRLLRDQGFSEYVDFLINWYHNKPKKMSPDVLQKVNLNYFKGILGGSGYPEGFDSGVAVLGQELEHLVGWEAVCRLAGCHNWNEWLETIPENLRLQAKSLLAV